MSKAEERAKERYWLEPNNIDTQNKYAAYVEGYHQAEKDLELTWEKIYREVRCEFGNEEHSNEEIFKEVLKRFKEKKETKV